MPANQSTPEVTRAVPAVEKYGPLSILPVSPTSEQRDLIRASDLYKLGDARLAWVNEGDLSCLLLEQAYIEMAPEWSAIMTAKGYSGTISEALSMLPDRNTRTPARGGDELRDAARAMVDWIGAKDIRVYASDPVVRNLAAALASTDMAGAGEERHPDDAAVDRFAATMKAKLAAARAKGRSGWDDPAQCSTAYLNRLLHEHVAKGDPVDVANFCMMLAHYGALIAAPPGEGLTSGEGDTVAFVQEWMMSGDHKPSQWEREFAAAIDARSSPKATATASVGEDWRDDTDNAPYDTPVRVRVGDMTFIAKLMPDAGMREDETSCDQWVAVNEGEHPPCWSGGACWDSNEDGDRSLQPCAWVALTDSGTAAAIGGERA